MAGRKTPHRRARIFRITLASLLLGLSPCWAVGAESAIRADLLVGFNGALRPGRRAPLIVSVENTGADLAARIEVEVSKASGLGGAALFCTIVRTVALPRGASRRVHFTITVPFNPRTLAVRIFRQQESGSGGAAAKATELVHREVDLRELAAGEGLFAAVSSDLAFDSLGSLAGPGEQARVVYPHAENLPDAWSAYECVDAVVVRDTASQRLKAAQVSALERWVFSGGTLVFTGGLPALMLAGSGFDRLLPVEVVGLVEKEGLPSLSAFLHAPRLPAGRITLADARLRSGEIMVEQDGIPLVVSRGFGAGRIWFFAFDCAAPPLSSWAGIGGLWRAAVSREPIPRQGADVHALADDPWMKPILASPAFSFPSPLAALAFAGCYILLLLPLALRRSRARIGVPLRALLLVAGSLLASVVGYLLFNRLLFDPRGLLADAAKVQCVSGDGLALVTEKAGLLSAERGQYGVSFAAGGAAVEESSGSPFTLDEGGPAAGGATTITGKAGQRFVGALFTLSSVVEFPLAGLLVDEAGRLDLSISNATNQALVGGVLVRGGLLYQVGDIPPGATERRTFSTGEGKRFTGAGRTPELPADPLFAGLWARALTAADREKTLLVARLPSSPLGIRLLRGGGSTRVRPLTMVVLELR